MKHFDGKVAVVTGGASGIGRALAERFATEGMSVAIADVNSAGLAEVAAQLTTDAPQVAVSTHEVDVRDQAQVDDFADDVFRRHGQVDVVCPNAGVFMGGFLWERPGDDIDLVVDVNLHGILTMIRAFVPRMIVQDTEGHVVCTASVAGLFGTPYSGPYNISKFAAFAAAEALAHDLIAAGTKLRGSVLCPGIIKTDIAKAAQRRAPSPGTESSPDQKFVTDLLVDLVDDEGHDPSMVADRVVAGIRSEDFLILTHDHHADHLAGRAAALVQRQLPPMVDYT